VAVASSEGEPNAQLMFYGRSALHTHPEMFGEGDDWPVDLYIVQPRARIDEEGEVFQKHTVTRRELEEFRWKLIKAVSEATGKDPSIKRGEWCRFAKCKTICPKFTGPALDLTKMHMALEERKAGPLGGIDIDWAVELGRMLSFAHTVEELAAAIRAQAHAFLADGNQIVDHNGNPLYKLVPKRPTATWTDAQGAVEMALKRGVKKDNLYTAPEPKSPAQMRAALAPTVDAKTKKAQEEGAKELLKPFFAEISSGDTLASINDRREGVVPASAAMRSLSDKLAAMSVQ
jgi:hypothetical protein